ncbi:MAG TPA: hypothetical protein VFS58_17175 [Steroidobacteraceae bacterium]|nr:hypothetical protein [Steroidobacteraceae bacterium]
MNTLCRFAPVVGLFLLAPLVAEFLLGNISIDALHLLPYFVTLYGGGAVLVREIARRAGRGWPTIVLLALVYALIEEGYVTQSLFAPTYFGHDLIGNAHIAPFGIGGWWTLYVLGLHTIWSICVPIAIVESFVGERARKPWLGNTGMAFTLLLFLGGAALNTYTTYQQEKFIASIGQFAGLTLAIAIVVFLAFRRWPARPRDARPAFRPWKVGISSFFLWSAFTVANWFATGWAVVATYLAIYGCIIALVIRWSGSEHWGQRHILAFAGGALITYAWQGFPHVPILGSQGDIDLIGNTVFASAAVALLVAAVWKSRRITLQ